MKKLCLICLVVLLLFGSAFLKRKSQRPIPSESLVSQSTKNNLDIPGITRKKKNPNYSNISPEDWTVLKARQIFVAYLEASFRQLPTLSSLKLGKDGNFHHVPASVIQSSEIFGEIAERLKTNPYLVKDGLRFYAACALNEQLVTSIRAVCARNLKDWSQKAKIDISKVTIPESIERIASVIPSRD